MDIDWRQVRLVTIALAVLANVAHAGSPQFQEDSEPPRPARITIEKSGTFSSLVRELESTTHSAIRIAPGIQDREIKVGLKDVGFFEVLDALCKSHGGASYFGFEGPALSTRELSVLPSAWIEFPTSYHEHFKVVISHFLRTRGSSTNGPGSMVDVGVTLYSPPWISVNYSAGARVEWTLDKALSIDEKNLLLGKDETLYRMFVDISGVFPWQGNSTTFTFRLRDFDTSKGLRVFSGKAVISTLSFKIARIPLEVGKSVAFSKGAIVVDSLTEAKKIATGTVWRLALTVTPKLLDGAPSPGIADLVEDCYRIEGCDKGWIPLSNHIRGMSLAIDSPPLDRPPRWIELRIRGDKRAIEVPFAVRDVAFRKD